MIALLTNITGNASARTMLAVYHKIFRSICILSAAARIGRRESVKQPSILAAASNTPLRTADTTAPKMRADGVSAVLSAVSAGRLLGKTQNSLGGTRCPQRVGNADFAVDVCVF